MKKFTKILAVVLALALTAALSVGLTLAYLTDQDEAVNVMTLGNVDIAQHEYQRVEENGVFTAELEAFQQGKLMMPYVSRENTPENITIGDFTAVFNDQYANYVDKIVAVTNTGKSDAYVRTLIALPTGGVEKTDSASDNWLHWNTWGKNPETGAYDMDATWDSFYDNTDLKNGYVEIEINGMEYRVWEFVHTAKLAAGATACPTLTGVYMDKRVNNDDTGYYMDLNNNNKFDADTEKRINIPVGEPLNVLVLSQAVQTEGFADAFTALDTAFGDVTAENAAEWFGGMSIPVIVSSNDELVAAIKAGETDILLNSGNYKMPDGSKVSLRDKTLTISGAKDAVIDVSAIDERDQFVTGATLKFEGVTLNFGTELYMGFANCKELTYKDCVINGVQHLYGNSITFEGCTLNVTGDHYMVRTWGGKNVTFNGCTFNCDGKAILVYNQSCNLTVNNCIFNDNGDGTIGGKAAIEACNGDNGDNCVTHNIVVNNTTVNGFEVNPNGTNTNSTLWANKNSLDDAHLNVTINGTVVY